MKTHYTYCMICTKIWCDNPSCRCPTCRETCVQELQPDNVKHDFCEICRSKMLSFWETQMKGFTNNPKFKEGA